MAKIEWTFKNEEGTNLNRYIATNVSTGEKITFDLLRSGNISVVGTPLNAENLNALITSINACYDLIASSEKDTTYTLSKNGNAIRLTDSNGTTNDVTLNKSDVGLGNVDNTSDMDKPISNATQQGLNKPLYNLGAFDTVSGNVITRKTGYVDLGTLNWDTYNNCFFTRYDIEGKGELLVAGYEFINSVLGSSTPNGHIAYGEGTEIYIRDDSFNNDVSAFKSALNGVILYYELSTSYTEEIIEGQPLITLDSQGSQWLREEWEKSVNLIDYSKVQLGKNYDTSTASIVDRDTTSLVLIENIEPNKTYYFSSETVCDVYAVYELNRSSFVKYNEFKNTNNGSFTTTSSTNRIIVAWLKDKSTTLPNVSNLMLNEGSHAYPYQPYNGGIVRQKQLDLKANKSDVFTKEETQALIDSVTTGGVELTNYYTKSETDNKLANKVDKVSGKGLSTNDFTNELKSKLESLSNYDDTSIQNEIASIKNRLSIIESKALFMDSKNVSGTTGTIADSNGYFYSGSFTIDGTVKSASFISKTGANNYSSVNYSGNTIEYRLYSSLSNATVSATIEYTYRNN